MLSRKISYFLLFATAVSIYTNTIARPLRVLFVMHEFPKFIQPFILNQMSGLLERGHEVFIYANVTPYKKDKDAQQIMPPEVEKYKLLKRTAYQKLPKKVKDVDILYCQFGIDGYVGLELKKKYNLTGKIVTCFRGDDITQLPKPIASGLTTKKRGPFSVPCYYPTMYKDLFNQADLFMPVCAYFKDKLIELGCNPQKIQVHHSAVNCKEFTFKPRSVKPNETVHIISNSRLVEMKGIEYAIRAFALVHQKHPNTRFTVIGDGPLKEHLQNVINQLSLTESVKLVGWKSHDSIPQLLHSAHIFVLPSVTDKNGTQEGIPNAIMEAMATGMPVVSTYHAGIPEVVQDGVSGFLVPERDVQALANKLELLVSRPDIWQRMGKAGRDIIEKTHNIEKENDDLVAIFKRLIA